MARNKLFISYSHEDAEWRGHLANQLTVLEKQGLLTLCDDTMIGPGEPWRDVLERDMTEACLAVLLISASFLNSDFVENKGVPLLFARHENDGMMLYPIVVRPCAWEFVPWLERLQMRPRGGARPVAERDEIEVEIVCKEMAVEILTMVRDRQMSGSSRAG